MLSTKESTFNMSRKSEVLSQPSKSFHINYQQEHQECTTNPYCISFLKCYYLKRQNKKALVSFLYAVGCSLAKTIWLKGVQINHFITWPRLTIDLVMTLLVPPGTCVVAYTKPDQGNSWDLNGIDKWLIV